MAGSPIVASVRASPALELRVHERVCEIDGAAWDALLDTQASPFERHAFFDALEEAGCVSERTGWTGRHLSLWRGAQLVAVAPAYVKRDSSGDFSRDWGWADGLGRIGCRYYPKLVLGTPFTPACSRRVQVAQGEDRAACVRTLLESATDVARDEGCGVVQALYLRESDAPELDDAGWALGPLVQLHWRNRGYQRYDDWLATLSAKRRHQARRERRLVHEAGFEVRTVPSAELASDPRGRAREVHGFYRAHIDRLYWGRPYWSARAFELLFSRMPENVELVEARRGGRLVAGALNLCSPARLYGRYWGAHEEHPFLHFTVCFYQSIAECIARGREAFEGGADGEHKIARGFEPALVWSAHRLLSPAAHRALALHLADARRMLTRELDLHSMDSSPHPSNQDPPPSGGGQGGGALQR